MTAWPPTHTESEIAALRTRIAALEQQLAALQADTASAKGEGREVSTRQAVDEAIAAAKDPNSKWCPKPDPTIASLRAELDAANKRADGLSAALQEIVRRQPLGNEAFNSEPRSCQIARESLAAYDAARKEPSK